MRNHINLKSQEVSNSIFKISNCGNLIVKIIVRMKPFIPGLNFSQYDKFIRRFDTPMPYIKQILLPILCHSSLNKTLVFQDLIAIISKVNKLDFLAARMLFMSSKNSNTRNSSYTIKGILLQINNAFQRMFFKHIVAIC